MKNISSTHIRKVEKGQSLVELAMGLTFLILLFGGVIDLGRAFFTYITLRDAAREGAVYGSYMPTDTSGIIARVHASATSPIDTSGIAMDASDVTFPDGNTCPGHPISVRVRYTFEITMPLLGTAIGGQTFPISAVVTNTILKSDATGCT